MNILIPYHWLKEHLDTPATPEELQSQLSLCGPSVERIYTKEGEPVFDIEVTTNRVDAMSVRGIAKEAAAILPEFNTTAHLKPAALYLEDTITAPPLDIKIINNPSLCHRILAVKISNIRLGPSPDWLQKRLNQVDQRPLNNAIDITNYVMWEIGHPVHVFDYDRLQKKHIEVREAKAGEHLTTLDGKTHTLKGGEVVFDDGTGTIIDLPGIMGTQNTVVTDQTKNVLLWIESVDATKIRQASMGLAIRSQAAILNEKHVDPYLGKTALLRAIELFTHITEGEVSSRITDIFPHPPTFKTVKLSQSDVDTYLGLHVSPEKITRILKNLGCEVTEENDHFSIIPPSERYKDLSIHQDFIEEIARIYGYHHLPSKIMDTTIPDHPPKEDFRFEHRIKEWLAGWGLTEVYTYSMVSEKLALQSGFALKYHLKIANPLTDDWVYLRRCLLPSLSEVLEQNPTHSDTIFELQNVYHPQDQDLPTEELHLAIVSPFGESKAYTQIKGLVDALMNKFHVTDYTVKPCAKPPAPYTPECTGEIWGGGKHLGYIGKINAAGMAKTAFHLICDRFAAVAQAHPRYIPVITTPAIVEDYTFTLPEKTYLGDILTTIKAQNPLIEAVDVKDRYQNNITFTVSYRHPERSLSDQEISPLRKQLVEKLENTYHAKLVGQLR